MQKNVGTTDAIIRMTGGLLGLAYGIGKMSRRPHNAPWLLMAFSAMKVAEGATRFCPMYKALGINTIKANGMSGMMDQMKQKGIQTVMNQVTGATSGASSHSSQEQKHEKASASANSQTHTDKPQAASTQSTTAESRIQDDAPKGELTPEDQLMEQAAREFISYRSQEKDDSSTRYPTYS
ncbi:YgaP family membrane protein [Brevibacillus parabrevis]